MADFTDKPGYSFAPGPPPEASRFFANKGLRPSFSWQDVEPEEHAVAFAVAKAAHMDVLTTIRGELQTALDEGLPFAQFQKSLRPKLQELGWWGYGEARDTTTGAVKPARLGSPRRLRVIYNANIRSARAAGQWERIQRTKAALPYLQYRLGPSERHRPHHETKDGLILPVDDPFWARWYPPNGWGCKCWIRQLTRAHAERLGVDDSPNVPMREVQNTRTGEIKQVPIGIDPGWERNPGQLRQRAMEDMLAGKLAAAAPDIAQAAARDIATSWRVQRMFAGAQPGAVPVAVLSDELQSVLGASTRVVRLRDDVAGKIRARHPEVDAETMRGFVDAMHVGPAAIERVGGRETLLFFVPGARPWMLAINHLADRGELWISTAHRSTDRRWLAKKRRADVRVVRE